MNINIKPMEELNIDRKIFIIQPDPDMAHRPYIELGGSGFVVQLLEAHNSSYHALKIFNNPEISIINNTKSLENNKVDELPGMVVAQRTLIDPNVVLYRDVLQKYPFLKYSVLMPWVGGYTWFEMLGDNKGGAKIPVFNKETSLYFASQLAHVLASLEAKGYAHCDICSNNIMLDLKNSSVQLIDIEDMYLPGASRSNNFIGGQNGYAHPNRSIGHQWVKESDRFGGGMLISEILTWYDPQIREISDAESYASPSELGTNFKKHELMMKALSLQGGDKLAALFDRLWKSNTLEDCPSLAEWGQQVNLATETRKVSKPVLDGLTQLGADGRIRIQRKRVSVSDKKEEASPVIVVHKKIYSTKKFKISIAYPKLLSKRHESSFLLQVYLPEERSRVTKNIKLEFQDQKINESSKSSSIKPSQMIKVKLFSPTFDFQEPVKKLIDKAINEITLLGMPKDNCEPGTHKVSVSISDANTDQEFESLTINVQVVDFAFDHISRPFLSKVAAVVLGIGSFAMFMLTFLEQIDKTVGFTSGTAAGVFALGIYASFYNLYQRVRPNTP